MDCLRALENTVGKMEVFIAGTSSRASAMVMVYGQMPLRAENATKDTICWIKSMATVYTIGAMDISIKVVFLRINAAEKASFTMKMTSYMKDFGLMASAVMSRNT